ncbi:hypothetical protein CAPTEDRAFT_227115 [Capitella teleta]|uniref:Alpha-mannosidase n=1 Tax=Capitella teleta TaxID=283909 RepID=R7U489_CAPTE|nr:hypothetical protein CAPTEDRAFT_227115 [Capitella teleta]|eukprot:ELT97980.1 hypothetical protein CAPTEDRAFT_227115 [Capitella teleta]
MCVLKSNVSKATYSSGEFSMYTHLEPFLLYNIVYSCGPDINVCCQFDFDHNKCWSWGKYQKPEAITEDNVHQKATALLDQYRKKSQLFTHNKLLVLHGDDFRFNSASAWDKHLGNLRRLFKYMNSQDDMYVKVKFATPGEYLQAAKFASSPPKLNGDFFTYNDRGEQYWSGYFSSRPFLKSAIRRLSHYLRSAEILYSLAVASSHHTIRPKERKARSAFMEEMLGHIREARETSALMQHHDAVTGTAAQTVAVDYLVSIQRANLALEKTLARLTSFLAAKGSTMDSLPSLTPLVSRPGSEKLLQTSIIQDFPRMISVYNPLAAERTEVLHLRVPHMDIVVKDLRGHSIPCQLNPTMNEKVLFKVSLAALSLNFFMIEKSSKAAVACVRANITVHGIQHKHDIDSLFNIKSEGVGSDIFVDNSAVRASFCRCSGLLQGVTTKRDSIPHKVGMSFVTYSTGSWVNPLRDKSGAYVFLPDGEAKELQCKQPESVVLRGPVASSVTTFLPLVTQTVTLFAVSGTQGNWVFIENVVNLLGQDNTELAMRLKTNIRNTDGTFFTDLNGFQMQKRKYQSRLFIQGNFYPMTSTSFLEDSSSRVSLLSAQSHGVASLDLGWLEVILDRRLMQDDWRGLNEGLTHSLPTHSSFALLVEDFTTSHKKPPDIPTAFPSLLSHLATNSLEHPPIMFFHPLGPTLPLTAISALVGSAMPCDYRLLNMRMMADGKSVLLVIHRVGVSCQLTDAGCPLGARVKIRLSDLFLGHDVIGIDEMNITGTHKKFTQLIRIDEKNQRYWEFDFPPMEIRTFRLILR